ncbi:MAG: urea transport system permease protein [Solirubrobacteraceae bacterium]|nr:urea transport system permease protein [Solirubrobacteraceae bacterium]MEA2359126.1 urea transport system permease protein [Solirubrobacteraceae bacterium]MEA2393764.1 urea transport system permease protein [Solirubrobacteraceae bacterium]
MTFALSVLTLFGFYALLAFGLGLIFGQLNVVNLAYGGFAVVGAYAVYLLDGLPFAVGVLVAVLVGGLIAAVTEWLVLRDLYERGFLATLLAMWGVGILLQQGAQAKFGATAKSVRAPVDGELVIFGTQYPTYRLLAAGVSLAVVAACLLVVYRTRLGLRLRAAIENREMASLLGIPPRLMISGTFVFGSVLGVLGGALQAPLLGLTPNLGVTFLAPAFFAVLIGRLGSLSGPVFGAFVVALLSAGLQTSFSNTVSTVLFYVALIVLIGIWPQGLDLRRPTWMTLKARRLPSPSGGS